MDRILKRSTMLQFFSIPVCWQDEHKSFAYTRKGGPGLLYDQSENKPLPEYTEQIKLLLPWMKNICMSYYKMESNTAMPSHVDEFPVYRELFKVPKSDVIRVLVFLEECQLGHYFELQGVRIPKWKAGDAVMWTDEEHAAGNTGIIPRYTLQITGHV